MGIHNPFKPNIEKLKKKKDTDRLVDALNHKDKDIQIQAVNALKEIGEVGVPHLLQAIKDQDTDIRKLAAEAFGRNTKEAIVIIRGGLIKLTNQRTAEITGYTEREILGKKFYDFVAPEYREVVTERYKKRLLNKDIPGIYEVELLSKDDKKIPAEINAVLIEYEERPADLVRIKEKNMKLNIKIEDILSKTN